MAGSRAGLKKVVKMVRGKKGTTRRTYWMKSEGAGAPKQGFLRRHAGKLVAGAALAAGGAYLAHKHRGAIGGAAKGALEGYRAVRNLGRGLGTGSSVKERLAGAGLGAAIRGAQGHASDKIRQVRRDVARATAGSTTGAIRGAVKGAAAGLQGSRLLGRMSKTMGGQGRSVRQHLGAMRTGARIGSTVGRYA